MTSRVPLTILACAALIAPGEPPSTNLAAHVDPYVATPRLLVLTDIANEPDDQMSMVRLLVYSNQYDIEGLVATTSTWMRDRVRPDVIRSVIDAYAQVRPNLLKHESGFPEPSALRVASGQPGYGMATVGAGKSSEGSAAIVRAVDTADERPLWIAAWGGTNTLAQALSDVRASRSASDLEAASTARVVVTPRVAGTAHVILAVTDNGSPTLTSYRRVILKIAP